MNKNFNEIKKKIFSLKDSILRNVYFEKNYKKLVAYKITSFTKIAKDYLQKKINIKHLNERKKDINQKIKFNPQNITQIRTFTIDSINPDNALLIIFLLSSTIIFIFIFLFINLPIYNSNSKLKDQIKISKVKVANINQLKLNIKKLKANNNILRKDKKFLINLIGGNSDLSTYLSIIEAKAKKNFIIINKLEPLEINIYKEKEEISDQNDIPVLNYPNLNNTSSSNLNSEDEDIYLSSINDLLAPELKEYVVDVSFKGNFVNILNFIEEIESLENIFLIGDFKITRLSSIEKKSNSNVLYKAKFSIYGKL